MMKAIVCFVLLFQLAGAVAQSKVVTSGLHHWKAPNSKETLLNGTTTYFDSFEVFAETIKPGKETNYENSSDTEELIIVKDGQVAVTLKGSSKSIGPGSVAFLMPGEKYQCKNSSKAPASFYRLKFKPKSPVDVARGNSNGGSFLIDWNDLEMKKTEPGGRRDFFNKPTSTCQKYEMHVTTLNEGLPSHAPHTHPEEEIILLIRGNATMMVADKDYPMVPGDFVFAASGDFHGIRNTGKGQCEYFAFQWK